MGSLNLALNAALEALPLPLSSRPERSEVEGPAVGSSSIKNKWKRYPSLCHPKRSREPVETADPSASLGMTKGRVALPCQSYLSFASHNLDRS